MLGRDARDGHFLGVVTIANAVLAALIRWMFVGAGMDAPRLWGWSLLRSLWVPSS